MNGAPDPSADDAFRRVQRGDQQAFADVYDLLAARVHGVVVRIVRDPAMSEEVTQEVFVEAWRTARRFDPDRGSVTAWILTMARRRAVDRVRSEQSQRNRADDLARQPERRLASPAETVLSSMDAARVRAALASLPDDQREVIELCFFAGLSHTDVADRLELPLGTVKGRVRGGLQKLRRRVGGP